LKDAWGNQYCARHSQEYKPCSACYRLVNERMTGGGITYPDGRLICNVCRKTAIDTKEQAKPAFETVAKFLHFLGLKFRGLNLRIHLTNAIEIKQVDFADRTSQTGVGQGQVMGYIRKVTFYDGNGRTKRQVDGITILSGLPRESFEGIAAHELGHAWFYLAKIDALPVDIEEGFCNLLSYLLYKNTPVANGEFWSGLIENDPDPIYGEGFRKVRQTFKQYGFEDAMRYLYEKKELPPLK
jgi:hypothetical protein